MIHCFPIASLIFLVSPISTAQNSQLGIPKKFVLSISVLHYINYVNIFLYFFKIGGDNQLIKSTLFWNSLSMLLQTKTKSYCRTQNIYCDIAGIPESCSPRIRDENTDQRRKKIPFIFSSFTPSVIMREKLR